VRQTRTYSAEERAQAVALAMSVGPVKAANALGYPVRTVVNWTHHPAAAVIVSTSREALAARFAAAVDVGLEAVLAGLRDGQARLGDRATALRVLAEQAALLTGQPTSRTAVIDEAPTLTGTQEHELRRWLDALLAASDDELRDWAANGGLALLRDGERLAGELTAGSTSFGKEPT